MRAVVNRRVAEADRSRAIATGVKGARGTVSPFCHVTFIPASEQYQPESRVYTEPGEDEPIPLMPLLVHGIDTTVLTDPMIAAMRSMAQDGFTPALAPKVTEAEGKRSVDRRL